MSADFDDMASKAKAVHEARMAQQDRQDTAQRDDRGRIVGAAVAALTAEVLPLLEKAAADGSVITVGVAKEIYDREPTEQLGSGLPGQSEALITQAVQKALDAYFAQLDKYRSIGVLQTPT